MRRVRRAPSSGGWTLGTVALAEAIDATRGVDELLRARVERVACLTDVYGHVPLGGLGNKPVTARAGDVGREIDWVNSRLHSDASNRDRGG